MEAFIELLQRHRVTAVGDVRAHPRASEFRQDDNMERLEKGSIRIT
jgi:hypothetical protein